MADKIAIRFPQGPFSSNRGAATLSDARVVFSVSVLFKGHTLAHYVIRNLLALSDKAGRLEQACVVGVSVSVLGAHFAVQGSVFEVQSSGFRVQGSGFRVQGFQICGVPLHCRVGEDLVFRV